MYMYRERELDYDATRNMDNPCVIDHFSIIKVQIVNLTTQNDFDMKYNC
jgi:hypothetical protein